ncbi:MAG: class I SAM-dependent methyltransferase [Acidobacteriaceae bacterium]
MAKLDFSRRADLEELMDGPCSYEELRACLHDISRVNRLTFAYRPTMNFLSRALRDRSSAKRTVKIVDVGCGYGDTLRKIERWAQKQGIAVSLLGADLNPHAIRAASEATPPESHIRWYAGDVRYCDEAAGADLIICSLVTHHLPEPEIVALLQWMERTARRGWFICDLHRMPLPYHLFSLLMRGPWWHRFIRHDGMASIRRSFQRQDWERMCVSAGVGGAVVLREYTPARLCVERLKLPATRPGSPQETSSSPVS